MSNYMRIKAREYRKLFNTLDFLGCLNHTEFDRVYYNGSTALRAIPMPVDPSLLEMWKPGLTPERVVAQRVALLTKMKAEIDAGRERRGECMDCGKIHNSDAFACLSN